MNVCMQILHKDPGSCGRSRLNLAGAALTFKQQLNLGDGLKQRGSFACARAHVTIADTKTRCLRRTPRLCTRDLRHPRAQSLMQQSSLLRTRRLLRASACRCQTEVGKLLRS